MKHFPKPHVKVYKTKDCSAMNVYLGSYISDISFKGLNN